MPVVKMRELLRNPKSVFETLERTREPVVLTRDGTAIASIFPVDPDQAVELAMAALPEFVESRQRARNARSEGRTSSAEEFLREYEARHGAVGGTPSATPATAAPAVEESSPSYTTRAADLEGLYERIKLWFGEPVSRELASGLGERIATASAPVLDAAGTGLDEEDAESQDFAQRVHELNCVLFDSLLPDQIQRTTLNLFAGEPRRLAESEEGEAGGVLGRPLAEQTLDAVTARVELFNRGVLSAIPSTDPRSDTWLTFYEASVRAAGTLDASSGI